MDSRRDLQLKMGLWTTGKLREDAGILYIFKVLSLVEVKILVCEHKNMHTDITGDETHTPLHGSPLW